MNFEALTFPHISLLLQTTEVKDHDVHLQIYESMYRQAIRVVVWCNYGHVILKASGYLKPSCRPAPLPSLIVILSLYARLFATNDKPVSGKIWLSGLSNLAGDRLTKQPIMSGTNLVASTILWISPLSTHVWLMKLAKFYMKWPQYDW